MIFLRETSDKWNERVSILSQRKAYVVVQNRKSFLWSYFGRLHYYFKFKTHDSSNYWSSPRVLLFAPFSSGFLLKLLQKLQGMSFVAVEHLLDIEIEIGTDLLASESLIFFFCFISFLLDIVLCNFVNRNRGNGTFGSSLGWFPKSYILVTQKFIIIS